MNIHDIADHNIERLLGHAYKPEPIDPAFLLETEEKLLTAARTAAHAPQPVPADPKILRLRRRMSWAMVAAAAVVGFMLVRYAQWTPEPRERQIGTSFHASKAKPISEDVPTGFGLTAKPRPESAKPQA